MGGHVAVVFAAGGSTRLGTPKQLLVRDGETLVHRAARLACGSGATRVLVVTGCGADDITDALRGLPVACVHNARWADGLATSVRTAAAALADDAGACLLLGCDQPALAAAHLAALLDAARAADGIAVSAYAGTTGVPVVVPVALLRAASPTGDHGLRDVLRGAGANVARVVDEDLAFDVDTPAQRDAAIARGWLDAP